MALLKNPLLSLRARGGLTKALTFLRRRGQNIVEEKPVPDDARSLAQLSWRHMYQKAVALWHALSAAEKEEWESSARPKHMTGFAWFMSQALRPNPGLYLPLQGGTMSGNIDMAKNRILKLPLPSDSQEPLTLAYYTANIAPYLYDEGARVWHNVAQNVPSGVFTILAMNQERYDTDTIHDLAINNSRLTCRTAGKYVISAGAEWDTEAGISRRVLDLLLNGATAIARNRLWGVDDVNVLCHNVTTLWNLEVNDFVEVRVLQNTGVTVPIIFGAAFSPWLAMQRIG